MKKTFSVILEPGGDNSAWVLFTLPFNILETWGSKGRLAVTGTINGFAFRSSIFPYGNGSHMMMVNKTMQKTMGVKLGDTVEVTMEPDKAPRTVEVPEELLAAFKSHPKAKQVFEALALSHKREHVSYIEDAKKIETRQRRIAKAIEMLESA